MREGWKYSAVRLGDIIETAARIPKMSSDTDVTFLGMTDVSEDGRIIKQNTRKYAEVSKGYTGFKDRDVLVAKITPCFENGKGALARGLKNGIGFGSTEFHVLRPSDKIDPYLLLNITQSKTFRMRGAAEMVGSAGQKRVPFSFIEDYKVQLPALEEQKKIAEILRTWDRGIEKVEKCEELLNSQKRGLMQKLLVDDVKNRSASAAWVTFTLNEIATIITGSTPPTNKSEYYGGPYSFVSPADISEAVYLQKSEKSLSEEGFKRMRSVPKHSVLFTCIGSTIGKLCISHRVLATNQQINAVIPDSKKVDIIFLYYALSQLAESIKLMSSTHAIPIINKSTFGETTINLPDLKEQNRISNILYRHDLAIENLKKKKKLLQSQKRGLMQRLLG